MVSDHINLDSNEVVILNRKEFEDNYHHLHGSCMAMFQVVVNTEDTSLITRVFDWQLEMFKLLPTEMGLANQNLIFAFLGMYAETKRDLRRLKSKILYSLKEENFDDGIIGWFQVEGKDSSFAKTDNEWFGLIINVVGLDTRSCEQINDLLAKGQGTDYDRIAIRVKGILEGYNEGDNLTFIIRKAMERLKII